MTTENEPWDGYFARHEITRLGTRSLELANPEDPNLWCTISMDDGLQLLVWGDFAPVIFGHNTNKTLAGRIAWIGSHPTATSYISEKARIGMQGYRGLYKTTPEAFEADTRELFETLKEDDPDIAASTLEQMTWEQAYVGISCRAMELIEEEPTLARLELGDYLQDIGLEVEGEYLHDLGYRSSGKIELAHAAIKRAHALLTVECS